MKKLRRTLITFLISIIIVSIIPVNALASGDGESKYIDNKTVTQKLRSLFEKYLPGKVTVKESQNPIYIETEDFLKEYAALEKNLIYCSLPENNIFIYVNEKNKTIQAAYKKEYKDEAMARIQIEKDKIFNSIKSIDLNNVSTKSLVLSDFVTKNVRYVNYHNITLPWPATYMKAGFSANVNYTVALIPYVPGNWFNYINAFRSYCQYSGYGSGSVNLIQYSLDYQYLGSYKVAADIYAYITIYAHATISGSEVSYSDEVDFNSVWYAYNFT